MDRALFTIAAVVFVGGCGTGVPKKSIEVPTPAPAPQFISASGQNPPRPIYDYNVAPAQYSLKPLEQWTQQEATADALGRIGPPAIPQLIDLLKSPEADVRLIAAQVLARMGSDAKEAVPALIPLLKDPDERVRKAATRTLGRIGPDAAAAVPELMQALVEEGVETPGRTP
ncbi:MAG: HEAT repeat domain-containing protein [Planctomycetaceae bacterium]|nr:HEAT repeat domain-containing protein [Planctomycetaceae bacterium]